jgi:hypothetical protein
MRKENVQMRTACFIVLLLAIGGVPVCADENPLDAKLIRVSGGPFLGDDGNPTAGFVEYACLPLEDNLATTGWNIAGTENLRFQNGIWIDTGGMVLLEFMTEMEATSIHLDLTLRAYDSEPGSSALVMSADRTFWSHELLWSFDDTVQSMTGSFDHTGNTFSGRPADTLEQIRLAGNRYEFLVWGPYIAAIHGDGAQGLHVLEAHLQYIPVPEPPTIVYLLGAALLGLVIGMWRRRGIVQYSLGSMSTPSHK